MIKSYSIQKFTNRTEWILAIVVLTIWSPSINWIARDSHLWPWDPAWYGDSAIVLGRDLVSGDFFNWLARLMNTTPTKPPGLVWIEQTVVFYLPFFGEAEKYFLLVQLMLAFAILLIGYRILTREFVDKSPGITWTLLMSGNLLFVGLTHQNFVEPLQLLSILVVIRNYQNIRDSVYPTHLGYLYTIAVITFVLMTKTTTIVYVLPFIFITLRSIVSRENFQKTKIAQINLKNTKLNIAKISLLVVVIVLSLAWYAFNIDSLIWHFLFSFQPDEIYSTNLNIYGQFRYWTELLLRSSSFLMFVFIFSLLSFLIQQLAKKFKARKSHSIQLRSFEIFVLSGISSAIAFTTTVLADNGDGRFLLPTIGLLSLLTALLFQSIRSKVIKNCILIIILVGAALHQVNTLSTTANSSGVVWNLSPLTEKTELKTTRDILKIGCANDVSMASVMLGVDLASINPNTWNFINHQLGLKSETFFDCNIFGIDYASQSLKSELLKLDSIKPKFFVTLADSALLPEVLPNSSNLNFISKELKDYLIMHRRIQFLSKFEKNVELYSLN